MKTQILLAVFLLGSAMLLPAATNELTSLLQQGLFDEEANRDLTAAIADYQSLATQFERDRSVAATAIYRLGECYRKLGQTNEAAVQYERLVRDFADQKDLVTLSRQNLTGLGTATASHFSQRLEPIVSSIPANPTEDEAREIVRIQQMIQNSPDLINAPGENDHTPLARAAINGWLKVAAFLLDHGADVNAGQDSGATALYHAANAGNRAMVELLISRGAEISLGAEVKGNGGPQVSSPLIMAIKNGYQTVVEVLLANKADVNTRDNHSGKMPLHWAAKYGRVKITQMLLTAGANPNVENSYGRTPLSFAARCGLPELVKLLLTAKADPNGGRVDAPLHCAIDKQDLTSAELLLQAGANPNAKGVVDDYNDAPAGNSHALTPLFQAVSTGQAPMVQLLLKFKADPNDAQTDARPMIFNALSNTNMLKSLLDAGAKVEVRDATTQMVNNRRLNWTPLICAVERNFPADIVDLLLQHGANPNLADEALGETALHWSTGWGLQRTPNRNILELLLAHQADPNVRDNDGRTLLDNLKNMSKGATPDNQASLNSLADLLRQHGALDHLPDWDRITASRPSANFSQAVFTKDTNDWNRFSLLELVAVQCQFLAVSPNAHGENDDETVFFQPSKQPMPYPDLNHLRIHRPASDMKSTKDMAIDLGAVLKSGDGSNDLPLEWGDVVEIPETDHPLNENWAGFSDPEMANLKKCLTRHVAIIVNGQTNIITLAPGITFKDWNGEIVADPQAIPIGQRRPASIISRVPFWLGPVLMQSKLVLASSDLSRIKVTRHDPINGKAREWILDCSGISQNRYNASDLWLRDGDVIEVPEKP